MGTLLSAAFRTSETRTESHTPRMENWLEAAMDGLLTVEAERFMLSLPRDIQLNCLAVVRPQIINELAELRRFRNRIIKRIEELLRVDFRHGMAAGVEPRLREELARLKAWFQQHDLQPETA